VSALTCVMPILDPGRIELFLSSGDSYKHGNGDAVKQESTARQDSNSQPRNVCWPDHCLLGNQSSHPLAHCHSSIYLFISSTTPVEVPAMMKHTIFTTTVSSCCTSITTNSLAINVRWLCLQLHASKPRLFTYLTPLSIFINVGSCLVAYVSSITFF
jgi:hypothetical protein